MVLPRLVLAATLLSLTSLVAAHGDDGPSSMDMGSGMGRIPNTTSAAVAIPTNVDPFDEPSYSELSQHSAMLLAHVVLMVIAWVFVLPLGIMFSISRARFALPVQFSFLVVNALGVIFGTLYNINTPDLYENNAHHSLGWVLTWIMTAQVAMMLIFVYSGRFAKTGTVSPSGATSLLTAETMSQHNMRPYSDYRWSRDSGQGTSRSSTLNSRDASPVDPMRSQQQDVLHKEEADPSETDNDDAEDVPLNELLHSPIKKSFLRNTFADKYLSKHIPSMLADRTLQMMEIAYEIIDRTCLILGFVALLTGGVTWAGLFRANNIFNGLAHFIKGGIFFWYGLLTLARWMGCFSELGWGWNVKPARSQIGQWKASLLSAEFVESFVIWFYGTVNVFLEHLAAWGGEWAAQDLEHVSISIMFFGGGLCGMLIESEKIRHWLNTSVDVLPTRKDIRSADAQALRAPPKTYATPMNPMPALIILLLGVMMSSHHQDSMVSTKVHAQWGTLLVGFALARGVTYLILYISPPASIFPSRPPSELVSAFCLISGGLIFMASTKDIVHVMEVHHLMAMFVFTVMIGFTAFVMAWEIMVLALKGWAVRKEMQNSPSEQF